MYFFEMKLKNLKMLKGEIHYASYMQPPKLKTLVASAKFLKWNLPFYIFDQSLNSYGKLKISQY